MAWSQAQVPQSAASGSSTSARNLAYGSNVSAGNVLLVAASTHAASSGATVAVTDSQGNTYSQAGSYSSSANGLNRVSLWMAIAGSSGANTVTATPSIAESMAIAIHEYNPGGLTSIVVDGTNSAVGTSTTPAPGSVAVTGADDLSFCVAGQAAVSDSATAGTGYTLRVNVTGSVSVGLYTEDAFDVSTAQSPSFTLASSVGWYALGVTFKGSSGGTTLTLGQASAAWTNGSLSLAGAMVLTADSAAWNDPALALASAMGLTPGAAAWSDAALSLATSLVLGQEPATWSDAALALATALALGPELSAWSDQGLALYSLVGLAQESAAWNAPAMTWSSGSGTTLQLPPVSASWTAPQLAVAIVQACSRLPFVLLPVNLNPPPVITLGGVCVIDNTESVTYLQQTGEGTFAPGVAVANALRRAATRDEMERFGKTTLVFHVWTNQLAGVVPKLKDRLTDDAGFTWIVMDIDVQTWGTRFRLTCVRAH